MEKVIWVIGNDRKEMLETQRRINSTGSMRALCLLSGAALERAIQNKQENDASRITSPSLIIVDYQTAVKEDFQCLSLLKTKQALVGVPLFFMTDEKNKEIDETCFSLGATVVLHKPFSKSGILRIEHTAWQHEVTKSYEKTLQKQANDLRVAREIMRLNQQLESRNELLYQVFGRYFSDDVLEVILDKPEEVTIGGERREVAVMIADLRGFTSLSEELLPDTVTQLLNFFFDKMLDVIRQYHGTVIEFLGDSILAVFGAPLVSDQPAVEAARTAICMQNTMLEVNAFCDEHGYEPLEMGIGLHCGEVFIGNIGSEKMMRYNVIGKVVNECSRIESLSVGGQVLVSEDIIEKITCPVKVGNQMCVPVKGISYPIRLYEMLGIESTEQKNIINHETQMQKIENEIAFQLYEIQGKMVSDHLTVSHVKRMSKKRAVVLADEDKLELFSNVKVMGSMEKSLFDGVYAKVIGKRDKEYTLHFTHVNKEFNWFVENAINSGK